jgi:hypothetical protein
VDRHHADRVGVAAFAGCDPGRADGLTVLLGGFLPVKSIPVEKIDVAAADHIDPSRWGGWDTG